MSTFGKLELSWTSPTLPQISWFGVQSLFSECAVHMKQSKVKYFCSCPINEMFSVFILPVDHFECCTPLSEHHLCPFPSSCHQHIPQWHPPPQHKGFSNDSLVDISRGQVSEQIVDLLENYCKSNEDRAVTSPVRTGTVLVVSFQIWLLAPAVVVRTKTGRIEPAIDLAQERCLGKFLVVSVKEVLDPAHFANHHNGTDCRKLAGRWADTRTHENLHK